ncbi:tuberoinfundibular peptide of 39 residues [Rhinatrema bivittatum]|uniref:tuberoinfundibular peptide of 39 residues n=1 Tax=Rhinatrema bivittatum TaxID=194408 RepID=UPI0011263E20|nr:tuberoinfundibular peptide of 39 residues [Rhinatrema bivittatum]
MPVWALQLPSITLHDWSLQMTASDMTPQSSVEKQAGKAHFSSSRDTSMPAKELPHWPVGEAWKRRSIVVADDAAFRERSKLLTAMERKKWLNAYIQKLLVVNSD